MDEGKAAAPHSTGIEESASVGSDIPKIDHNEAQLHQPVESREGVTNRHLVILAHGIRDIARWQAEISSSLEAARFTVELTNFDRMNLLEFLLPIPYFRKKAQSPILNEVGTSDPWPAVAESVTTGCGSAGTYGFRRPGVRDRFHNGAGHGYFLNSTFCNKYWVPFLNTGMIVPGDLPAEMPPLWVRLISIFKIKYVLLAVAILLALPKIIGRF